MNRFITRKTAMSCLKLLANKTTKKLNHDFYRMAKYLIINLRYSFASAPGANFVVKTNVTIQCSAPPRMKINPKIMRLLG